MQRDRKRYIAQHTAPEIDYSFRGNAPIDNLTDAALVAARETLTQGITTLGLTLPEGAVEQLLDYLKLLLRWNRVYNLTAVRDPAGMTVQHLLDSLAALPALQRHTGDAPTRILDVGSGGGLPGVVWAVACPQHRITCVDTVAKKATFLRQVAAELGLSNLSAEHARVEELKLPPFPLITARAFASLPDIVRLTRSSLAVGGTWIAMKGQHPQEEIDALPADIDMFHVEPLTVPGLDAERCLVWMRLRSAAGAQLPLPAPR